MPVLHVAVTITGSGNVNNCYATINGTKQYEAGMHEVNAGDTITFGVFGGSSSFYGSVTIDGTKVLTVTDNTTQTYDWTVPSGISTIKIAMNYTYNPDFHNGRYGRITVTTA